jgi:uncharacterized membrane protein YkoI
MSNNPTSRKGKQLARLNILIVVCFLTAPLQAESFDIDQSEARFLVQEGIIKPLPQILSLTSLSHLGKVLEIELEEEEGLYIYEIEALDNSGVIHEYKLNAHNGELLPEEAGN